MPGRQVNGALRSVLVFGIFSRIVIFVSIFAIAPHVSLKRPEKPKFQPTVSWSQMKLWDGEWYERIATSGYEYQPDGREHDIAFFPLYPALVALGMQTGLSFAVAGAIISNLAFFGALYLLYQRTAEHHGSSAAQWAVAAMACCPLSVFCSVTYTESLFVLVTLAFLQAFEKQYYWLATTFAGLAAACRVPGIVIAPSVLVFAFIHRLPWRAYLPAVSAISTLGAFMWYQDVHFHDALAFVHIQSIWEHTRTAEILLHIFHPINVMRIMAFPISVFLLWSQRRRLCRLDLLYASFSLILFAASLQLTSIHRFVFAVASILIAAGLWLSKYPRFAKLVFAVSAVALSCNSVAWAWDHFIG